MDIDYLTQLSFEDGVKHQINKDAFNKSMILKWMTELAAIDLPKSERDMLQYWAENKATAEMIMKMLGGE